MILLVGVVKKVLVALALRVAHHPYKHLGQPRFVFPDKFSNAKINTPQWGAVLILSSSLATI
jgi:hypothetical protein